MVKNSQRHFIHVLILYALVFTALNGLLTVVANAQVYYLGVLSPQGSSVTQQRWQPWVDTLNQRLPNDSVVLVALDIEQLSEQLKENKLDLVLAPQSQFIHVNTTGWRWLATLPTGQFKTNLPQQQTAINQIGSTIWVKKTNPINSFADLKNQRIAAVDKKAFGGYLLGLHAMQQHGITADQVQFDFVGYPIERTLQALQQDTVDAAITPLCLMEDMHANRKIDISQFRAISSLNIPNDTGCITSTKTFPNWTLAATKKAPDFLVNTTHRYVFEHNQTDTGAKIVANQSQGLYWLPAASTQEVEQILIDLNSHPSQKPLGYQIVQWLKNHVWLMLAGLLIFVVSTINYIWMSGVAIRQRQKIIHQHQRLREYDDVLSKSEKLLFVGEMSAGIAHEVNQPLSAIQNYAQGALIRLQKSNLDKQATEFVLNNILTQVQRSSAVIQNIRYLHEPQKTQRQSVDLLAVIRQCLLVLERKLQGIQIYYKFQDYSLLLPPLLLDQILINVLLNAQQQGAKHIFFMVNLQASDNTNYINIDIIDDAGGFQPTQIQTFNHQSSQYTQYLTSTKENGMGVGLSICRKLCESVGGEFRIDNITQTELSKRLADDVASVELMRWQTITDNGYFEKVQHPIVLDSPRIGAKISLLLPLINNSTSSD